MFVLTIDSHDPDQIAKHLRALAFDIDGDLREGEFDYSDVIGNVDDLTYEWQIFADEPWVPMIKVISFKRKRRGM